MTRLHRALWAALFALALAVPACAPAGVLHTGSEPVPVDGARFESFTYVGDDEVYRQRPAEPDQFTNPILPGFYPDPSIARAGDDYYLVTSSFSYFPGVPIFHSRDLVSWTQIGHVLDRPSQLPLDGLGISRGIFAPTIRHHDGTFYMITTWVDAGGNALVTTTDPAGPWSDPVWLPFDGIDPDIFFDEDGTVYISNNGPPIGEPLYDGHRALWLQEYDSEAREMVGERRLIVDGGVDITQEPVWIEAPHIFKKDGLYYLLAAEGGTSTQHSAVIFRSESVWGPYEPWDRNPILTQRHLGDGRPHPVTSAGHADFVELPNGDWWAVFLATRPYADDFYNTGRETFLLPVEWTADGWPTILEGTDEVPYVVDRPALPEQPAPPVPTSGNFRLVDDFDGDRLAPYWTVIRTPETDWHRLNDGALVLDPRPVHLGEMGQPSFVGRRQQHLRATAETVLHFDPGSPNERAGLAAFQNDDFYYLLSVGLRDGQRVVEVERRTDGASETLASVPLSTPPGNPVHLRLEADGPAYHFSYSTTPDDWRPLLRDADGTVLSTQRAGGFVGTMIGMYASSAHPPAGRP